MEDQVEGRNSVIELLESGKDVNKIYIQKGEKYGSINKIIAMAKDKRIVIVEKDKRQMDQMAQSQNYQGVIAIVPPFEYCEIEDILDYAKSKDDSPFVLILDGIEDTHNLGAIIRTAETAGVHGIILPQHRSVGLTPAAVKSSAGAVEYVKVARVHNLTRTIEALQKEGIWFYAVTMNGEDYRKISFEGGVALVIGAEEDGISRLVLEKCDYAVSLPMTGRIESLNASVAAGIMMYRVFDSRQ